MRGKKTKVYGLEGMTKSIFVAFLELYIYYSQHKGCYKCFLRFLLKMKQELKNATLFRIKVVEKEKLVVLWSLLLLRDVFNWLFFFWVSLLDFTVLSYCSFNVLMVCQRFVGLTEIIAISSLQCFFCLYDWVEEVWTDQKTGEKKRNRLINE